MLILGLILSVFAIGFLCWLLFTLAVYALPCFVGLTAGLAIYHHGSGALLAMLAAVAVGAATLTLGQLAFASMRAPLARTGIALVFAAPASIAGYYATLGLSHIGGSASGWNEAVALFGALMVGGTSFARMAIFVPIAPADHMPPRSDTFAAPS